MSSDTDRELREAAMAASNGPWFNADSSSLGNEARYIALASPSVVLALLDRVEKLEAGIRAAQAESGNRWSGWGMRAEGVAEILEKTLEAP